MSDFLNLHFNLNLNFNFRCDQAGRTATTFGVESRVAFRYPMVSATARDP